MNKRLAWRKALMSGSASIQRAGSLLQLDYGRSCYEAGQEGVAK